MDSRLVRGWELNPRKITHIVHWQLFMIIVIVSWKLLLKNQRSIPLQELFVPKSYLITQSKSDQIFVSYLRLWTQISVDK